jgi:ketosteroid isomerase-like protein
MAQAATSQRSAEATARAAFDAFMAHDVEALLEIWHPEGIQDWVALGIFRGHAEIRELFNGLFAATPDLEMTIERVLSDDRFCMIAWRSRATHDGQAFMGIEPTGRELALRGVDIMEVEDGLVVRNTVYYDGAAYARGLGMLPPQDSGAEKLMIGAFNGVTKLRRAIAERT